MVMMVESNELPKHLLLTEYEVARYLGMSVHWLRKRRRDHPEWPPLWKKLSTKAVRYMRPSVSAYANNPTDGGAEITPRRRRRRRA